MRDEPFITPTASFIITIIVTLMLGVVDWVSGFELQFFVFYFIPVAVAGWTCTPGRAYFVAILSAAVWYASDWFSGHPYIHISYAFWNTAIRLLAFMILGYAVIRIRVLLLAERKISSDLQTALSEVKTLKGLLPICAGCKKIRNDKGYWQQIEEYIEKYSDAQFTHGYCQQCLDKLLKETGINMATIEQVRESDFLKPTSPAPRLTQGPAADGGQK